MARVIVLGSSNAVPDEDRDNTHLLVSTSVRSVLIDCGENPLNLLRKMNIDVNSLTDLILTHFHPDHVAAAPLLLMDLWLVGRKAPLRIHGLVATISRMKAMMELYEWENWPGFYDIEWNCVPEVEMSLMLDEPDVRIWSSPVKHLIPTIGLRLEFSESQRSAAYSCDTEPCDEVVRLGKDVDLLIHEATGGSQGHSSPAQAADVANRSGAKSLCLIHYPGSADRGQLQAQAQAVFSGPVTVAKDLMTLDL